MRSLEFLWTQFLIHCLIEPMFRKFYKMTSGLISEILMKLSQPCCRLNQMLFFKSVGLVSRFSEGATAFLDKWTKSLNLINKNVKLIRRTQMDCELLQRCKEVDVVGKQFCGVIIDSYEVDYGFYEYTVYLEELKLLAKVRSADLAGVHSVATFSMFVFDDEDKLYKKVRLQMI